MLFLVLISVKFKMIGKINHIAIAVPDLISAREIYKHILGASVSDPVQMPDHGVTTVFVDLPNTKIELLEPLGDDSPIQKYLLKNPKGGMHHICFEVEKITETINSLKNRFSPRPTLLTLVSF